MLAQTAYEQFGLDEVWIMPNGNPPHKRTIEQTDFLMRCKMIQLAIEDASYMVLCDVEGSEKEYHFTYQTLGVFQERYPDYEFYFIIGADSLRDFPAWREPAEISKLCTLLVACRDEDGIEELQENIAKMKRLYDTKCLILHSEKVDAASSEIRSFVSAGQDVSAYVGEKVSRYIIQNNLYK